MDRREWMKGAVNRNDIAMHGYAEWCEPVSNEEYDKLEG